MAIEERVKSGRPQARASRVRGWPGFWGWLARLSGAALLSLNLLWVGACGLYSGLVRGGFPWPQGAEHHGVAPEPASRFDSEASSMAVVRGAGQEGPEGLESGPRVPVTPSQENTWSKEEPR